MSKIITLLMGVLLLLVVAGPAWAQDVTPQHTDPGWQAVYFNNTRLAGPPVLVRDDPQIDFNWGGGSQSGPALSVARRAVSGWRGAMKQIRLSLLVWGLVMLGLLSACGSAPAEVPATNPAIRGGITNHQVSTGPNTDILGSILIEGQVEGDTSFDKAAVTITAQTHIYEQTRPICPFSGLSGYQSRYLPASTAGPQWLRREVQQKLQI